MSLAWFDPDNELAIEKALAPVVEQHRVDAVANGKFMLELMKTSSQPSAFRSPMLTPQGQ